MIVYTPFKQRALEVMVGLNTLSDPASYKGFQMLGSSTVWLRLLNSNGVVKYETWCYIPATTSHVYPFSTPVGGVSQLNKTAVNALVWTDLQPADSTPLATLRFAYSTGRTPILDVPLSLSAGPGVVQVSTLTGVPSFVSAKISAPTASASGATQFSANFRQEYMRRMVTYVAQVLSVYRNTAVLRVYSGAPPASADDAATGTLLAQKTYTAPSGTYYTWYNSATDVADYNDTWAYNFLAGETVGSGVAGYARLSISVMDVNMAFVTATMQMSAPDISLTGTHVSGVGGGSIQGLAFSL